MEVTTQESPQKVLANLESRYSNAGLKIENRTENSITCNAPQPFSGLEMVGLIVAGFFTFGLSLLAMGALYMLRRIQLTVTTARENGATHVYFSGNERLMPASEKVALAMVHGETLEVDEVRSGASTA